MIISEASANKIIQRYQLILLIRIRYWLHVAIYFSNGHSLFIIDIVHLNFAVGESFDRNVQIEHHSSQ